jgi:hypothetical protein
MWTSLADVGCHDWYRIAVFTAGVYRLDDTPRAGDEADHDKAKEDQGPGVGQHWVG